MARRATRKHSKKGLLGRVYSPIHHTLMAAKNIVGTGISGIDSMGLSLTGHANAAVRNVFTRKGGRKASRKSSRKASRKSSRKSSRKTSRK